MQSANMNIAHNWDLVYRLQTISRLLNKDEQPTYKNFGKVNLGWVWFG